MLHKKFFFQSLIGGAVLALALKGLAGRLTHAEQAPGRAPDSTSYDRIDRYIEEQMTRLSIPGAALAIVEGDQIVHLRGFGHSHPGGDTPTPQTPFFIGSLTKSFTALAVMQLVEAGKIELEAPVKQYLPWFTLADHQAACQITVRHLLNQTSGLSTWSGWSPPSDFNEHPGDTVLQARALSTLIINHPPGSVYEYSNLNYDILGLIIEAASGETYADYVQFHIFDPLEMLHSYTSQAEAKQNGLAAGHRFWFWTPFVSPNRPVSPATLPSGEIIASAEDMGRYLIAQLNQGRCGSAQILSPAGIAEMHRPAAEIHAMDWTAHYGMGWYNEEHDRMKMVWHTGMVPDFSAYMAILPEQKKGLVLLLNADHFLMNPVITEIGHGAATRLAGQPPLPSPFGFSFASLAPWASRALLLIPLLQILGVVSTLRKLSRWSQDYQSRPSRGSLWGQHILLPLIPNLAFAAVPVYLQVKKRLGFLRLYFPDLSWIAIIGGAFAGGWALLRAALILRTIRKE